MADLAWPADLRPVSQSFWLQPHIGGSESPVTRTRKVYGLSAPRWLTKLTFRKQTWAGRQGEQAGRIEALIAQMEGGLNRVQLWDFRRERTLRPQSIATALTVQPAAAGASQLVIAGFSPQSIAFLPGDYVGGDGRPHLVIAQSNADGSGVATVSFRPPLSAAVLAGAPVVHSVPGWFRLTSDQPGLNETVARQPTEYTLDFAEALT